jgi:DNA-binding FadR family transcriptional regulator
MPAEFGRLKFQSLKGMFIAELERMIISGSVKPGERLPPERELAERMGVSRTVVNAGILDLASKGFLRVIPRKGTFVCDYRQEGTLAIFSTLLNHLEDDTDLKLLLDTNTARKILEIECARSAALNRHEDDVEALTSFMEEMKSAGDTETLISLNVGFHHRIAVASGNMILCVLLNAFNDIIRKVLSRFYAIPSAVECSLESHALLLGDIAKGDGAAAAERMARIFEDSERIFRRHHGLD